MPRVKRGTTKNKSRKNTLAQVKGYRFGRSTKKKMATEAIAHAGSHAFAHRKQKKSNFRRLWNVKINAEVRKYELSYSKFIDMLNKKDIKINRKMLADLAENNPESFKRVVDAVK
ncbi:MAG: large subunit ribosomal protein L20 [Candidatus Paceibacteria bacterium]|jgi:large subunit ribosomal protein L20